MKMKWENEMKQSFDLNLMNRLKWKLKMKWENENELKWKEKNERIKDPYRKEKMKRELKQSFDLNLMNRLRIENWKNKK